MTHNSLVDAQHVISRGLEVAIPHSPLHSLPGGIIRRGDVAVIRLSIRNGLEGVRDLIKSLNDVSQQVHRRLQLLLRIVRLHRRRRDGDVDSLSAHRVIARHHRHVDVCLSPPSPTPTGRVLGISGTLDLLGRNDDLRGLAVASALHGVVQQTNRPHHLSRLSQHVVGEVRGISHREVAGRRLAVGNNTLDVSLVVEEELVGVAVQHEHAALDGAETREALGQSAQAVHGVDVGRGAILVHRVAVELHRLHRLQRRLVQVVVVQTQSHRVARELLAVLVQTVLLEQLTHRHVHQGNVLVGGNAVLAGDLHAQYIAKEAAVLHLLHQRQEGSAEGLLRRRGHLRETRERMRNLAHRLVLSVEHEAALHLLEVQVVRHLRQKQHRHQIAASHQELGNQIHVVVSVLAQLRKLLLRRLTIAELLVEVLPVRSRTSRNREVQRSAVASVVVVAVEDKDLDRTKRPGSKPSFLPWPAVRRQYILSVPFQE